ncbi:hypothetical protein CHCC20494_1183 [Bacillus licheniformis]|nr:hypothetical protein CHCC20494_1183 [Bacillus licheniformis]
MELNHLFYCHLPIQQRLEGKLKFSFYSKAQASSLLLTIAEATVLKTLE